MQYDILLRFLIFSHNNVPYICNTKRLPQNQIKGGLKDEAQSMPILFHGCIYRVQIDRKFESVMLRRGSGGTQQL